MDENLISMELETATLTADVPEPIITLSGGSNYVISDTADYPLLNLEVYGNSVQESTPTPNVPVPIVSVGDDGFDLMIRGTYNLNGLAWRTQGSIIIQQPISIIAKIGDTATFSVGVNQENVSYQWQQNTGSGWVNINTTAGRKASFSIESAAFRDSYRYRCVITDTEGNSETSNTAVLYVAGTDVNIISGAIPLIELTSPLYGVSASHCDRLVYDKESTGKVIRQFGVVILMPENITGVTLNQGLGNLFYTNIVGAIGENSDIKPLCNRFLGITFADRAATNSLNTFRCFMGQDGRLILRNSAADNRFTTVEGMQEFIATNQTIVVYPLATPQEVELSTAEIIELSNLRTFEGASNVYNTGNAEMTLRILRREFNMKYIEWLKESKTWICPKSGKWKVVCVGGGASGGLYREDGETPVLTPTVSGGTTSFGSIVSADGAPSTSDYTTAHRGVSGYGGYTGTNYGGAPAIGELSYSDNFAINGTGNAGLYAGGNPTASVGYGAGGGAVASDNKIYPIPGRAGAIESTIVDIDEGQMVICTVGKGGKTTDSVTKGSGADGVIIVQYLGY